MMSPALELLPGTWLYRLPRFEDLRGSFVKTFQRSLLSTQAGNFDFAEEFYSSSHRDVVRGMHFQAPPHDHIKLVYCPVGSVLDVLLDLRAGPGYGRVASVELSEREPGFVWVPKGVAHGFRSLEDGSVMVYKTSTEHAPAYDCGVRWDSFGFDWRCDAPVVSERDRRHATLTDLISPF